MEPLNQSLTEAEIDRLDAMLSRAKGGRFGNVEAFDGFMTALAVCPELIPPSEYMPVLQEGKTEADDLVFTDRVEARDFLRLVMRHWNSVSATLRRDGFPALIPDPGEQDEPTGNDWARGFLCGTHLRPEDWNPIIAGKTGDGMIPIFILAHEHDPDPAMRPYDKPIDGELHRDLLAGMVAGARELYRAFAARRRAPAQTPLRSVKIGRNSPWPCGSGRKYKRCCGDEASLP